jgi:hypothetical protein
MVFAHPKLKPDVDLHAYSPPREYRMMPGAYSPRRSIGLPQWRRVIIVAVSCCAFAPWDGAAQAGSNLVQNGGFEQTSLS